MFKIVSYNSILAVINNKFHQPFPAPSSFANPFQSSNLLNKAHILLIFVNVIVTKPG